VFAVVLGLYAHSQRESTRAQEAEAVKKMYQDQIRGREAMNTENGRAEAEKGMDFMLFNLRDKLEPLGRPDLMEEINSWLEEYYRSLHQSSYKDAEPHLRAAYFNNLGEFLINQGKLPEARQAYESALAIRERLAVENPNDSQIALAKSYDGIAEVLRAEKKLPEAIKAYESALAIRKRRAVENSKVLSIQNELAESYDVIEKALRAEKKLPEAKGTKKFMPPGTKEKTQKAFRETKATCTSCPPVCWTNGSNKRIFNEANVASDR
jgi:tetratricopeptide (TPR) repeat protein